jgi:TPR repeat protein
MVNKFKMSAFFIVAFVITMPLMSCSTNQKPLDANDMLRHYNECQGGKPCDSVTTAYWLTQAAEHGSNMAAMELAKDYRDGVYVPKDITRAYMWENIVIATDVDAKVKEGDQSWLKYTLLPLMTDSEISKGDLMATQMYDKILANNVH